MSIPLSDPSVRHFEAPLAPAGDTAAFARHHKRVATVDDRRCGAEACAGPCHAATSRALVAEERPATAQPIERTTTVAGVDRS